MIVRVEQRQAVRELIKNMKESKSIYGRPVAAAALVLVFVFCTFVCVYADDGFDANAAIDTADPEDISICEDTDDGICAEDEAASGFIDISDKIIQAGGFPHAKTAYNDGEMRIYASSEGIGINVYTEASERLVAAVNKWNGSDSEITLDVSSYMIPTAQCGGFISTVINLSPECFIFENRFKYTYDSAGYVKKIQIPVSPSYDRGDIDDFVRTADSIISAVDPSWTGLQKIMYIHDYLVTHIDYDNTLTKHNAYNAIVEGDSVCQGYALAYAYLIGRIDGSLDCQIVTSNDINHAWNIVTLNGSKYYIDATWDDPVGEYRLYNSYDNFLVSQNKLRSNHNSSDWLDVYGDPAYGRLITASVYDDSPWSDMHSVIPMFGNKGYYYKGYAPIELYSYDFNSGESVRLASFEGLWKIWNGTGNWAGCYSALSRCGNNVVMTLPQKILLIDQNGNTVRSYDAASKEGYIYGAYVDGNILNYDIYTAPQLSKGSYVGRYTQVIGNTGTIIKGDVTGDGVVAIGDVVKVARAVAGTAELTEEEKEAADVTGDNTVAIGDVVKIARFVEGSITRL